MGEHVCPVGMGWDEGSRIRSDRIKEIDKNRNL